MSRPYVLFESNMGSQMNDQGIPIDAFENVAGQLNVKANYNRLRPPSATRTGGGSTTSSKSANDEDDCVATAGGSNSKRRKVLPTTRPEGERGREQDNAPCHRTRRKLLKPKSPYICYSLATQYKVKEQLGPGATLGDVAKRVAHIWKVMSPEERSSWDEVAKREEQRSRLALEAEEARADAEEALVAATASAPRRDSVAAADGGATSSQPSSSSRITPPSSKPGGNTLFAGHKRPISAYTFFTHAVRDLIVEEYPEMHPNEVSKEMGKRWRKMTNSEREVYMKMEASDREALISENEARKLAMRHREEFRQKLHEEADAADAAKSTKSAIAKSDEVLDAEQSTIGRADQIVSPPRRTARERKVSDGTAKPTHGGRTAHDRSDMAVSTSSDYVHFPQRSKDDAVAFEVFQAKMEPVVVREHPEMTALEVTKAIVYMWQDLSDAERSLYLRKDTKERRRAPTYADEVLNGAISTPTLRQAQAQLLRNESIMARDLYYAPDYVRPSNLSYVSMNRLGVPTGDYVPPSQRVVDYAIPSSLPLRSVMLENRGVLPMSSEEAMMYTYRPQRGVRMMHPMDAYDLDILERSYGHRGPPL